MPPILKRFLVSGFLFLVTFPSPPASAQSFDSNGVKLHYIVEGKGQPIVLIHGLGSNIRMNWQLPGVISILSKNYQVIALDLPGHGESDKPTNEAAYGTEMVEDVVRLLDHLNIKRAHMVGYSMGGMIAMRLMATHQDRVLSGIVGGMGWLRDGSGLQRFWERIPERQSSGTTSARSRTPSVCAHSLGKLALTEAELRAIKAPVGIIVGDRDPTKRLYVTPLQQVLTDWPVVEIKGAGHLNCIVKPQFKEAIGAWLSRH
ncbi:MAG TPA: alpha/beta fold hydrolase [Blastocatellia bacterium]|nr:alpha/beta fold hydrolase [Blastocatellia bacterium]